MCGESWLAIKDSLTHGPSSQGWAPECPLGSILYVYFVLLSRMVRQWVQGWPLHMPICSWADLKGPSLPRNLSSLLSGNATSTISCAFGQDLEVN